MKTSFQKSTAKSRAPVALIARSSALSGETTSTPSSAMSTPRRRWSDGRAAAGGVAAGASAGACAVGDAPAAGASPKSRLRLLAIMIGSKVKVVGFAAVEGF